MSPVETLLRRLLPLGREAGHVALDAILDELPPSELAALLYAWPFWARPAQLVADGAWRTWGFLCGRGYGKTRASIEHVVAEVAAGRARRIALVGPNELKTIEITVTGESGLANVAPPWLGARWEPSTNTVRFANGAVATIYSAESPDNLRGPEHDLALATELSFWPAATRDEALSNLRRGLRLGRGQLVWDSTPRRRNPLIRKMLDEAKADPARYVIVRGASRENAANLAPGVVADWQREIGGTMRGREELEGEYIDDPDDALFRSAWIERSRRTMPSTLARRIIAVDPAISDRPGADATGIVEAGAGIDAQIYVLANLTGKYSAASWPELVVDRYIRNGCGLLLVERNRGGDTHRELVRHAARARGHELVEVGEGEAPPARAGVLYYRSLFARGQKAERAEGASALLERGRVSFVAGELGDLEERLCTFDGRDGRPDDAVDAFVHAVVELGELGEERRDLRDGFRGYTAASAQLHTGVRGAAVGLALDGAYRLYRGNRI